MAANSRRISGDGRLHDVHNIWYVLDAYHSSRMNDRNSVPDAFKSEAQSTYNHVRVHCNHDPVNRNCWRDLHEAVVDEAGATEP